MPRISTPSSTFLKAWIPDGEVQLTSGKCLERRQNGLPERKAAIMALLYLNSIDFFKPPI